MSQHDFDIANQGAASARADINNALKALASTSSGPSEPFPTYANMLWYDTSTNVLYKRNESDSDWIPVGTFDEVDYKFMPSAVSSLGEAQSGTKNDVVSTPLRVTDAIKYRTGYNKVWQTVTRSVDTNYQNTDQYPREVLIKAIASGGAGSWWVDVGPDTSSYVERFGNSLLSGFISTASITIPPGHYYRMRRQNTNVVIDTWSERTG